MGSISGLVILEKRKLSCPCQDLNPGSSILYHSHDTDHTILAPIKVMEDNDMPEFLIFFPSF